MKIIFSILISIFIFTGCTNALSTPNTFANYSKQELIQKANDGNIKAMIELNRVYLFPETKEGYDFYSKWYKLVFKSKDTKDIIAFANVYKKYKSLFINGEQKYIKLLEKATNLGDNKALEELINYHLSRYGSYEKLKKIRDDILASNNKDKILTLYNTYVFTNKRIIIKQLQKQLKEKGIKLPIFSKYRKVLDAYYSYNKKDLEKTINEIIESNNYKLIIKTANFLSYKYEKKAIKLLKRAIEIRPKDVDLYVKLAKLYSSYKIKNKEKEIENLKKASLLDDYDSTSKLLKIYTRDKKYIKDYSSLEIKLLKLNEAKRALGDFIYKNVDKSKGSELLNELANNGNEKAILELASRTKGYERYYDFDALEQVKKWQKFVLNTNKAYLISMLKKKIQKDYLAKKEYKKLLEKLEQKELNEKNIFTLRDLYEKYRYYPKNKRDLAIGYKKEAIKLGDIKTAIDMAKRGLHSRNVNKVKESIAIYEDLAKKGEIKAIKELANFYSSPPLKLQNFKDIDKSAKFYEQLLVLGDKSALNNLVNIYFCGEYCRKKSKAPYNEKKLKTIVDKLVKEKNAFVIYTIANRYNNNKYINRDIKKALYYYKIAAKLGDTYSYYYIGGIYEYDYKKSTKAFEYYLKGADKGNYLCQYQTAYYYEKGIGVKKNINKAIEYYKKAAPKDEYASFKLARIYLKQKDYINAIEYLKENEKKKNPYVLTLLGNSYEKAQGVKKDITKALKYYKESYKILKDDASAYSIGLIYYFGKGSIEKDINKAIYWLEKANLKGAKTTLSKLYIDLGKSYEDKDIYKALGYYKRAYIIESKGLSSYKIGEIYHHGKGAIKPDIELAKMWYKKSNTNEAKKALKKLNKGKK